MGNRLTTTTTPTMTIELVYALPRESYVEYIAVPLHATIAQVLALSHLQEKYPEVVFEDGKVGVFGKAHKGSHVLKEGDRVEVYRPLPHDPKALRRRKAAESSGH